MESSACVPFQWQGIYLPQITQMSQKYSDTLQDVATTIEVPPLPEEDSDSEDGENNTLIGNVEKRSKPSCLKRMCKVTLALAATTMFIVMLVQLWTNYGNYIENRVFSPTVVAAGTFNREGAVNTYVMKYHKWEEDTLHVTMNMPENPLVQVKGDFEWGDDCLLINSTDENVTVMVWSLWSE